MLKDPLQKYRRIQPHDCPSGNGPRIHSTPNDKFAPAEAAATNGYEAETSRCNPEKPVPARTKRQRTVYPFLAIPAPSGLGLHTSDRTRRHRRHARHLDFESVPSVIYPRGATAPRFLSGSGPGAGASSSLALGLRRHLRQQGGGGWLFG